MEKTTEPADKMERLTTFMPIGYMDEINLSARIVQKYICRPTRSGAVCTDDDAVRFVMLCKAQRLNPFAGDAYLVGYDSEKSGPQFSLITSHSALLKRAESMKDEFEGMESGIIFRADKDGKIDERQGDFSCPPEIVLGGWAKVYRKGRKETYRRLSISSMAPKYPSQFWQGDKAFSQIVKCAEADALRSAFPALCAGLYSEAEQHRAIDITSEIVTDKRPELTGHTKALKAPEKEETKKEPKKEPKPAPEPEKPAEEALPPGLEPEPEEGGQPPAADDKEFKPRNGETASLTKVRRLLFDHGKSEEMLIACGIRKKFVKEGQKLGDLTEKKLEAIAADQTWKSLLSEQEFK